MNADEYLNLMAHLNTSVVEDPTALLALTVAWLDPLAILEDLDDLAETDLGEFYDSGDEMGAAIRVARDCFPGIYAGSISKIRDGAGYQQAVEFIGTEITEQTGIPIDQYEEPIAYAFGIPLPFYGAAWEDPDFIEDHPELTDLALLLGATREERYVGEIIDLSTRTYQVAHILQSSLWADYDKDLHRSIMWAIGVCTAATGNSSCDLSYDFGIECQPLAWIPDEVAFASSIIREAEQIMTEAHQALERIQNDTETRQILINKIKEANAIVDKLEKRGKAAHDIIDEDNPNPFGLRWDNLHTSLVGDSATDPELLQFRMDVA
jgi:hypothetical protein